MDGGESSLVFIIRSYSIEQHELNSLQMASLRGQVERSVLVESVDSISHKKFVNLKHCLQNFHRTFLTGNRRSYIQITLTSY